MDIGGWLRGLGLERYEQAFRENEIELRVLPELTADDLKELGVAAIGHRRLLLKAIADLAAGAERAAAEGVAAASAANASAEAERRQLTVMFCDLVGSTPLSTRFDPEDLREIVGAYHRCVADTAARFGGFVAKYMGDGVLIYFGYPEAHEDDAERAARAGLAVIDAVGRLVTQEPLNVRIGIASGLVVVGDLIGAGAAQERGVVGETPNLAARLLALARPGTLVVADSTRRQIGTLFEIEDLGPQPLAGFAEPQRAWRVVGESGVVSRFEGLRSGTTPLVGRDEELDLLLRRWQQSKSGEGRVVLVSGEPGIGKSRLTAALSRHIESEPHTRLRYSCSPHDQDSALYPFIVQLERAAGFTRDDTATTKLDKLETLLGDGAEPGDLSLIIEMLSLSGDDRFPPLDLSPRRKKERTLAALLRQLRALARRQPILMIFEDLHWIDPTSRELLDLTVEAIAHLPVLLVATYRPEFQPSWVGHSQVTVIALNRLGRGEGARLVHQLAGNLGALPPDVVDEIVERTDGVPLFVEEMTKAVVEASADSGYVSISAVPPSSLAVPVTLHASLLGRLDRLGPAARNVAQVGAAIGRDFSYELLAAAAQLAEPELQDALRRLVEAGLVFQRGVPPTAEYLFKHALVQDTAYSTLLRGPRQALHRRIAEALEAGSPEIADSQPELLARHFAEAGLPEPAIALWQRAGERASERSANPEAIAHFRRAIAVLKPLPETRQRDEREATLQAALISPLWASRGFGSTEARDAAARSVELGRRIGADTHAHFRALYGLVYAYLLPGDLRAARPLAEELLQLAGRLNDREHLAYAQFEMGCEQLWSAELTTARAHLEQGIALYDPQWGRPATSRYAFNCSSDCHAFLSRVVWQLGYPDQAMQHARQAVAIADEVGHPFSQAVALSWAMRLHQARGDADRTLELAEREFTLATEQGFPFLRAHGDIVLGWGLVKHRRLDEGLTRMRLGITAYHATGAELENSHWAALLAEAYLDAGRAEDGLPAVSEALDRAARTGIVYHQPELYRLQGELQLALDPGDAPAAEAAFRRALDTARAQQAKSWELRAATSLARLWRDQGRQAEARPLLAPIYAWFTEGFGTADLKDAGALLDGL